MFRLMHLRFKVLYFGVINCLCYTDSSKHVNNDEIKDEASVREQLDAWTAHRTESGVVYYYNSLTGVSTYEKPLGFKDEVLQPFMLSLTIRGTIESF